MAHIWVAVSILAPCRCVCGSQPINVSMYLSHVKVSLFLSPPTPVLPLLISLSSVPPPFHSKNQEKISSSGEDWQKRKQLKFKIKEFKVVKPFLVTPVRSEIFCIKTSEADSFWKANHCVLIWALHFKFKILPWKKIDFFPHFGCLSVKSRLNGTFKTSSSTIFWY